MDLGQYSPKAQLKTRKGRSTEQFTECFDLSSLSSRNLQLHKSPQVEFGFSRPQFTAVVVSLKPNHFVQRGTLGRPSEIHRVRLPSLFAQHEIIQQGTPYNSVLEWL